MYLVSHQMPHCSIFRNLEMREVSRHVSIPALQGWLYKYPPSRPQQPCPLIQKQPLAAALAVQQRRTLSGATSSPPPASSPRATPHLTSLLWSPGAGGGGQGGRRQRQKIRPLSLSLGVRRRGHEPEGGWCGGRADVHSP